MSGIVMNEIGSHVVRSGRLPLCRRVYELALQNNDLLRMRTGWLEVFHLAVHVGV